MANYDKELKLTIFKILKEAHKWYREDFQDRERIISPRIRGMLPTWIYHNGMMKVYLDTDHSVMAYVQFDVKPGELFFTDLTFMVAPTVINEYEVMESLLIGLVSLYAKFKEQRDAL